MSYSTDSKLGDLLDNPATKEILEKHMPGVSNHPQLAMGRGFSLKVVAQFAAGQITPEMLTAVEADLVALG